MSAAPGTGLSALGVARLRAMESAREDRLFDDPYAEMFVSRVGGELMSGMDRLPATGGSWSVLPAYVAVRTRVFDDYFAAAAADGFRQAVLLAAGLDARAYRLDWPADSTVFELDLPDLQAFKDSVLADHGATPACTRVPLAADLRADWPELLRANGFDPAAPTAWLAEGLLALLHDDEHERLLERVGLLSAPGSRLALGHLHYGRPLATEPPEAWLAAHGWEPAVHAAADLGDRWDRPVPADAADAWFAVATLPGGAATG